MKRLSQVLAWVLVFGIVGLSIVPPDYRVITDLPRPFEHLSIFLLTGVAFGVGYPDRYPLQTIAWCSSPQLSRWCKCGFPDVMGA